MRTKQRKIVFYYTSTEIDVKDEHVVSDSFSASKTKKSIAIMQMYQSGIHWRAMMITRESCSIRRFMFLFYHHILSMEIMSITSKNTY